MSWIKKIQVFVAILIMVALACNFPTAEGEQAQQPTDTSAPPDTEIEEGEQVVEEEPAAEDTVEEAAPTETPTATPTISHSTVPSGPASISSWMTDRSTKSLASQKRANADEFNILLFERPFTSETMDYKDYLDITRSELSTSPPWVYITIFLEGMPPEGEDVRYGAEFDTDVDGRGDFLVLGLAPSSTEWTTSGVYVYRDSNNDVGGATPIRADGGVKSLNGYDTLLFAQGYETNDPDGAWIRRDPSGNRMQLAVKSAMVGLDEAYMWGAWADAGVGEPTYFDYNDYFTTSEAGSPVSDSSNYPLKQLASLDNTCRWSVGFTPLGNEPGVCYVPPTPTATSPPPTVALGSITGYVFNDFNGNGVRNAGEPGIPNATVRIGRGACASTGLGNRNSGSDGGFMFNGLTAGTYCITVSLPSGCGQWAHTSPTSRTVTIAAGEAGSAGNFGFAVYICMAQ